MVRQLKVTASNSRRNASAALLALLVTLATLLTPAHAQKYTVLHTFTGGADGKNPLDGLSMDPSGNLYGTASGGGDLQGVCAQYGGCGVVFKMKRVGSSWLLNPLYSFMGAPDGRYPLGRVIIGPDGALYGTTQYGGQLGAIGDECGVVYRLTPPATAPRSAIYSWSENILYSPSGQGGDGCMLIDVGGLAFDTSGNLYGTTYFGGEAGLYEGTVFELAHSGGQWTKSTIHSFNGGNGGSDGESPSAGVTLDHSGNVFGTTNLYGCEDCQGTVFQLTPSQSGWTENTIHDFIYGESDGNEPNGGVILDSAGNLYGTTVGGGSGFGGTIFQIVPSGDSWNLNLLYSLDGEFGPFSDLLLDSSGNLYGTAYSDGEFGFGSVFKLSPSGDGWTYTSLYDFHGGTDGGNPESNLIMDAAGNLYGTASAGGSKNCHSGCGVVFEITP